MMRCGLRAAFLLGAVHASGRETERTGSPSISFDRAPRIDHLSTAPLVLHLVAPNATDPAIDQALRDHYVWLDTSARSNHRLLIFLPGATGAPFQYQLFGQLAARLGYHSIGLTYPDSVRLLQVCQDAACWENARLEILDGIDRTKVVDVNRANSVYNRMTKLLRFLAAKYPREGWSYFLERGKPKWSRIAVAGHSQGGGMAVLMGKLRLVARVVVLSAPPDGGGGAAPVPMPWLDQHRTPTRRYYGLAHDRDVTFYPAIRADWTTLGLDAFGPAVLQDTSRAPYDFTHTLITDLTPIGGFVGNNAHNSTVGDRFTPLAEDGTPLLQRAWAYLLTAAGHDGDDDDEASEGPDH